VEEEFYLDFRTSPARCADEIAHVQQQQQQQPLKESNQILPASVLCDGDLSRLNTHQSALFK